MQALAFDCSDKSLSAAIIVDGKPLAEVLELDSDKHSVTLLPMLERLCAECNLDIAQMDYIALTTGPGAFTALRIAAATAKGFALALRVPLVGVSTLAALALNAIAAAQKTGARICPMRICTMMSARNGLVYTATFQAQALTNNGGINNELVGRIPASNAPAGNALAKSAPIAPVDDVPKSDASVFCRLTIISPERLCLATEVLTDNTVGKVIFLGDGALKNKEMILNTLGENAVFATEDDAYVHAGRLGIYAASLFAQGKLLNPLSFTPTYLQASAAERNK